MAKTDIDAVLENISSEDTTKGENYYARKFKSCYMVVRKSLVALKNARRELGNKEAVEKTKEVLLKAYKSLEN